MGQVGVPFGVRGWVRVHASTEYPDSLLDYDVWWLGKEGDWKPYKVVDAEVHAKSLVVQFEGFVDRDQVARLRNLTVAVPREELPQTDADEYYWTDLIGLQVVNLQGVQLGEVKDLLETGANDVLVLKGERQRMIPFVGAIVQKVDYDNRTITVDWGEDY